MTPQMAHDPPLARTPGELVALQRDDDAWRLEMTPELQEAGLPPGTEVEFDLLWDDDGPLIVLSGVPDDVPAVPGSDVRRTVEAVDDTLTVAVPEKFLEADADARAGLGLAPDRYPSDTPLYFEPIIDHGMLGLAPLAYEDGTPWDADPHAADHADADDESVPARVGDAYDAGDDTPGRVLWPGEVYDPRLVALARDTHDLAPAAVEDLRRVLDALQDVDVAALGSRADVEPLAVEEARVVFLERDGFDAVVDGLDREVAEAVVAAARLVHEKLGERVIEAAGDESYAWASRDYDPFVVLSGE